MPPKIVPSHLPRGRDPLPAKASAGAEGATAPETLRQKDRGWNDSLDRRAPSLLQVALTEGVSRNFGNLSGPRTDGARFRKRRFRSRGTVKEWTGHGHACLYSFATDAAVRFA